MRETIFNELWILLVDFHCSETTEPLKTNQLYQFNRFLNGSSKVQ